METMNKKYRNVEESLEKSFNDEEKSITHIISVEVSDRYGDIVRADGMDKSHYEKNPVVLYGHDSSSLPVGKSLWQKKTVLPDGRKAVIAKTKFADTPEGNTVYALWKDGFLNAASIGFLPKTYEPMVEQNRFIGYDIKEWELLEYSIVPIPANQEALRLHIDEFGDNLVVKSLRDEMNKNAERDIAKKSMDEMMARLDEIEMKMKLCMERCDAMESSMEKAGQAMMNMQKNVAEIVAGNRRQSAKEAVADLTRRAISDINKK